MPKLQRTVLLVDDVKEDRVLIRRALRQDPNVDYQVLEAENGAQALAYLHARQPDCLILDYKLPDTDGLTLLKTVVDQAAPHIYPIVMLTSTQRTTLVVETMQQGAHDFLPKATFTAEHLLQAIHNAIEKVALLRQLDEQREWFRLTLNSIRDGVIATNEAGYVTFMNPVAETLTGWPAAEAQGQPLAQVFVAQDEMTQLPVADPVTQVLRTNHLDSQLSAIRLAQRRGRHTAVEYSVAPIQDRLGHLRGVVVTFRDITERRQAEEALRRQADLMDRVSDAVVATDAAFRITSWNKAAERIYGWTAAEALGRNADELFSTRFTALSQEEAAAKLTADGYTEVSVIHHDRSGGAHYMQSNVVLLRDRQHQMTGTLGVLRDITNRKAAEDALRASEEFNRTVLESSPDCVNVLDATGCLLMMNKPGLALLEIDDFSPLYSQPWTQLWPAECTQEIQAALSAAHSGETAHFQAFVPTAKGTPKWWDVSVAPVRNATGEFTRFVVVARDITESKRAEELLYERTALIQGLIESTPTPIWAKDRAGRTTLGNQATFDLLAGGVPAQVLGHTAVEMFPTSEQARQILESDQRVMRTGSAEVSEQAFRASDQLRFFHTTKAPLRNMAGEVVGLVGVSTDITERRQAEANQQFLLDLDAQTRLLTDPAAILATTVERLGQYLGGLSCTFVEINLDKDQAVVCAHWRRHDTLPTLSGSYKISEVLGEEIALTLVSGQSVAITDLADHPHTMARAAGYKTRLSVQSMVIVPFHLKGALLATLGVTNEHPRTWRTAEVTLLENVIARLWPLVLKAHAEQALRRQEAFVRQIADNVPGLVGYLGADERYRFVNATFETWFQCPRQQIMGRTACELLGAENYAKFTPYRQQALAGKTVTYESVLIYPDGITRAIWGRYQPDLATDGRVLGFYLFVMDITERKQLEEALRASEAQLNAILYNIPASVYMLTTDHRYRMVNRVYEQENQITNAEIYGQSVYDRWPAAVAERLVATERQVLATKAPIAVEETVQREGEAHTYATVKAPLLDASGEPSAIIGISLDITARKRAEAALVAREAFLRSITDAVPNLIGYIDRHRCYRFVNATYAQWFARPREQIEGSTMQDLLGEQLNTWRHHWQRALAGDTVHFEETFTYPDGVTRTVMGAYIPHRNEAGEVLGFYLYINDITARKRAEASLRESEARMQLAVSVGGFGFHDINLVTGDLYWSDELYALHHLPPGTKVNLAQIDQLIHPGDRQRMQSDMQAAFDPRGTGKFEQEFRIVLPDTKETLWLYNKSQTYFEGKGKRRQALRNTGIVADITARKRHEEQQKYLLKLSDALRPLSSALEIQNTATHILGEYLQVDRVFYVDMDDDQAHWVVADSYAREGLTRFVGRGRIEDFGWTSEELLTGKTVAIADVKKDIHLSQPVREAFLVQDVLAVLAVPLIKAGQWVGTFALHHLAPRHWSEEEIRLTEETAERTWAAVERARAEVLLRASEEQSRYQLAEIAAIYAAAPVGLAVLDIELRYLRINERMAEINGIAAAEHIGRTLHDIIPAVADLVEPLSRRVIETGQPLLDLEVVGETMAQPGVQRTWLENVYPLRNDRGEVIGINVVVQEITERKQAEAALRESEARQAIILETMAEGVVTTDREGRFFSANAAAERILGVARSELIGQSINAPPYQRFNLDGTPWGDRPVLEEVAVSGQRIFRHNYIVERRDGSRVVVARNITAMHTTAGALLGFVSTLSDITEQKRAETALRDSEERFRAVANLVPDLLWSNDSAGMTEWHNQRWLDYNGQMLEKASADGWLATVHPDDRASAFQDFQRALAQGEPLRQEERIRSATGEYRWFLVQATPFKDATGNILRWFGAATDIHEQRMARETLEQRVQERTHELEALSVSRQQLLARVITAQEDERRRIAHELHDTLGQFLSALNLRLSLLQQSVRPHDGEVSPVVAELGQLWHLVNEIDSELRRLTMELRPPILDDLGLEEAIRRYVEAWSRTTAIPVDVYTAGLASARLTPTIELTIYRIVQEALTNVLKHAQASGVSVLLERRPKALQLIIEDNGVGFDPKAVGDQAAGRRSLGLIGMQERAALVGGRVDLETALGAGTTVYVYIPLPTDKSALSQDFPKKGNE